VKKERFGSWNVEIGMMMMAFPYWFVPHRVKGSIGKSVEIFLWF